MPVKPIYHRSPMSALSALPLGPGQVRIENAELNALHEALNAYRTEPVTWEGLFRLACLLHEHPMKDAVSQLILGALEAQGTDGAFQSSVQESVSIARAAMALYEYGNSREVLQSLLMYCSWVSANWKSVIAENMIRRMPADLMELLVKLYRYTGKTALLSLCERLRKESINWTGVLHTYSMRRPTAMTASWLETRAGIDRELDADDGQYTRLYMTSHAETLADGMRATTMNALFSGSGDESSAGSVGWTRIKQWHGAVCGGTTADECVQGSDPSVGIDAASQGAWLEAFLVQFLQPGHLWAAQEADLLLYNGFSAAFKNGKLNPYQRVNFIDKIPYLRDCYHTHGQETQKKRSLLRLGSAWVRAYQSAVMTTQSGCDILFLLDGEYTLQMNGTVFRLSVRHASQQDVSITFLTKADTKAMVRLRIPEWMHACVCEINGKTEELSPVGGYLSMTKTWRHGDVLHLTWTPKLQVVETFHQGLAVMYGNRLYSLNMAEHDFPYAMVGAPSLENDGIYVDVAQMEEEKSSSVETEYAMLPVLPRTKKERLHVKLVPYDETVFRLTVFPKGQQR
ncbi:MAG: glycoside hydrolase family 127 protein [Clostridia bacterium]|nr:glycoside hydrolase family 127 protein [Clostridia bacterium]